MSYKTITLKKEDLKEFTEGKTTIKFCKGYSYLQEYTGKGTERKKLDTPVLRYSELPANSDGDSIYYLGDDGLQYSRVNFGDVDPKSKIDVVDIVIITRDFGEGKKSVQKLPSTDSRIKCFYGEDGKVINGNKVKVILRLFDVFMH